MSRQCRVVLVVSVLVPLAILPAGARGADAPEPSQSACERWHLQRIRLGATVDEVRSTVDRRLKAKSNNRLCAQIQKGAAVDVYDLSTDVCFHFDQSPKVPGAVVRGITVDATSKNLSYGSLLSSLRSEWGLPATQDVLSRVKIAYHTETGERTTWLDNSCDIVAEVVRWTDIEFIAGTRVDIERYQILLGRFSRLVTAVQQQESQTTDVLFGDEGEK